MKECKNDGILCRNRKINLWAELFVTVLLLVCGVLLIISCVDIYLDGAHPFTPESIKAHFLRIAAPIFVGIFSVVAAFVLSVVFPYESSGTKGLFRPLFYDRNIVTRGRARLEGIATSFEEQSELALERKRRRILISVFLGVCALLCAICVAYFLDADNFGTENYNRDVIQALMLVLPAAFAALSLAFAVGSLLRASLRRENEALRRIMADAIKRGERPAVLKKDSGKGDSRSVLIARVAIAVIALAFVVLGIFNKGISDVLGKAIRICTECIGLG